MLVELASEAQARYRLFRASRINKGSSQQLGEPRPGKLNVFVETRVEWQKQAELAGFIIDLDPSKVSEWPDPLKKGLPDGQPNTPQFPYVVQIDDGKQNVTKTWESMYKEKVEKDEKGEIGGFKTERGATILEAIALVRAHPEILDHHRIALPGSSYGLYDIVEMHKNEEGKVVISHVFVADTNTGHDNPDRISPYKKLAFSAHYSTREPLAKAA